MLPEVYSTNFRIASPLFTANENRLIVADSPRSFLIYDDKFTCPVKYLIPSFISASDSISCLFLYSDKLVIGTVEGNLLCCTKDFPLTLMTSFASYSITSFSTNGTSHFAIGLSSKKNSVVSIFPIANNQIIVEKEILQRQIKSTIKEIKALSDAFLILTDTGQLFYLSVDPSSFGVIKQCNFYNPLASKGIASLLTCILTIFDSILIVGFSTGVIGFYHFIKPFIPTLITTLHWHSSGINALSWDSVSKSLYSGASEGVLCIWRSPVAAFISQSEASQQQTKYHRTTKPSSTLPSFGSPLIHIALSSTGHIAVTTKDNTLRVLNLSAVQYNSPDSKLVLLKSGPARSPNSKLESFKNFPDTSVISSPEGVQVITGTSCSHVLGVMPTGAPIIPGIPSLWSYASSLVLSSTEVLISMINRQGTLLQLALWRENDLQNWVFIASALEPVTIPGSQFFFLGPLDDRVILVTSDGRISLWNILTDGIQKISTLSFPYCDPFRIVAADLSQVDTSTAILAVISSSAQFGRTLTLIYQINFLGPDTELELKDSIQIDPDLDSLILRNQTELVLASSRTNQTAVFRSTLDRRPASTGLKV